MMAAMKTIQLYGIPNWDIVKRKFSNGEMESYI